LFQRVRFKKALERDTNSKEKIPLEEHTRLRSVILLRIQWPDLMRRGGGMAAPALKSFLRRSIDYNIGSLYISN
jgi:hypothetical protein